MKKLKTLIALITLAAFLASNTTAYAADIGASPSTLAPYTNFIPHEGTEFKKGPSTDYYVKWISAARKAFPNLAIVAGSWVDRLKEIPDLLVQGQTQLQSFRQ